MHGVRIDVDTLDRDLAEVDALMELVAPRADDLVDVGQPERDEEQPRLVDVVVVLVHDDDLNVLCGKEAPQAVGAQRPPGSPAEDHDPFGHDPIVGHVISASTRAIRPSLVDPVQAGDVPGSTENTGDTIVTSFDQYGRCLGNRRR